LVPIENLTDENFLLQSAKHYKKSYFNNTDEFLTDLKRIKYIKKLLTRYKSSGVIDERLLLNHIIILNNIFGPIFLCRVLYLKLSNYFEYIKPFLLYLKLLPEIIILVNGKNEDTVYIPMNQEIVKKLTELHQNRFKN